MQISYTQILRDSFCTAGNNICLGIDPQWQKLPEEYRRTKDQRPDIEAIREFLERSLYSLLEQNLSPAAFKPNLGYFQVFDRPLLADDSAFAGSRLLAWLQHFLADKFPRIPIILDFKKGDISRSSANYAEEGFALWGADALTVSPYMGSDSIAPFGTELRGYLGRESASLSCALPYGSGGVYALLRTSNPGARDLQSLLICAGETPLFAYLARMLLEWRGTFRIPGLGAVVGATSRDELRQIAALFSKQNFPLLIPGVGKQGGNFQEVQKTLAEAEYPAELARINLSSGLLQNWPTEAPKDWPKIIAEKMNQLILSQNSS